MRDIVETKLVHQCSVNRRFIEMQIQSIDFDGGIVKINETKYAKLWVRLSKCEFEMGKNTTFQQI